MLAKNTALKLLLFILCAPVFFAAAPPFSSVHLLSAAHADKPNAFDWRVKAQSNKAKSKTERVKKLEIGIIYSGNTRGELIPYPPSDDALGGLSRAAYVIKTVRKEYPVNFSLNVGNMLDSSSSPLRVKLTSEYYDYMNFDAIAPGEGELALGTPMFGAELPIVISNMRDARKLGIAEGKTVERDGYRLYVINLIGKSFVNNGNISANISTNMGRVKSLLDKKEAKEAHLRVAVVHAGLDEIKKLAETAEGIDIIIAGSLKERFDAPLKTGSAMIVSAGSGGGFAGSLSVLFDENKNLVSITNKLYPVYQNIPPDAVVEKIIKAAVITDDEAQKPRPAKKRGLIPFVSDRNGTSQIFVKNTVNLTEYQISGKLQECHLPTVSADGALAAFIFGPPQNGSLRVVNLKTLNAATVPVTGNVTECFFSPDNFLYFAASDSVKGAVYKTRLYMDDAVTVLEVPPDGAAPFYRDVSLSPDGSTLLFCAELNDRWQVFAVDSSGAAPPEALTTVKADNRYPRFSPDGKFIAYLSDRGSFGGKPDLWIMEPKRPASHKQITFHANISDYRWSKDSKTVYFSAGTNVTDINSINIKEKAVKKLTLYDFGEDSSHTLSNTAPRMFEYNKQPKLIYTNRRVNGTESLRMVDLVSGKDEPVFKIEEGNERTE